MSESLDRFRNPALALALSAVALTAASDNYPQDVPHHAVVTAESLGMSTHELMYLKTPDGDCTDASKKDSFAGEAAAKACVDVMKHGRIALVGFNVPFAQLQKVAAESTQGIKNASNGEIGLQYFPLEASTTAMQQVGSREVADNCVDSQSNSYLTSAIADETMPELKDYNLVVAVTNQKPCTLNQGGVSDVLKGRHADVYIPYTGPDDAWFAVAHETGHLLGLGHASEVECRISAGSMLDRQMDSKNFELNTAYFNQKGCIFDEYGEMDNLMSASYPDAPDVALMNSVQKYALRSVEARAGVEVQRPKRIEKEVVITAMEASKGQYATLSLDTPVRFTYPVPIHANNDPTSSKFTQITYDKLAFVPEVVQQKESGHKIYGLSIYLCISNTETALLGMIDTDYMKPDKPLHITSGNQVVEISMQPTGLLIKKL